MKEALRRGLMAGHSDRQKPLAPSAELMRAQRLKESI